MEKDMVKIDELRKALPRGAYKAISQKTGFCVGYVGMVMRGEKKITIKNCVIIENARIIAKKQREKIKKIIEEIKIDTDV